MSTRSVVMVPVNDSVVPVEASKNELLGCSVQTVAAFALSGTINNKPTVKDRLIASPDRNFDLLGLSDDISLSRTLRLRPEMSRQENVASPDDRASA